MPVGGVQPVRGSAAAVGGGTTLTPDLLLVKCSKGQRGKNESKEHFLARLTHLQLQNSRLTELGGALQACPGVRVLYAYENRISRISGLDHLRHLQHLYLQNNNIEDLAGLSALVHLQKLYLSHNQIGFVSGLDAAAQLEQLHIGHQRIQRPLEFDLQSISALRNLRVLDVSYDKLSDLKPLAVLTTLEALDAGGNDLGDIEACSLLLQSNRALRKVDLHDNPLSHVMASATRYRDAVILLCDAVESIDEKDVSQQERDFVRQLMRNRQARMKQQLSSQSQSPSQQQLML